jgi:hypothetical protein
VTFAPSTRRIYVRSVRSAFGLQVFGPPRPPHRRLLCGSCSSGQSFAFSFLSASPCEVAVAVQLGVLGTQGPQGTLTPSHFLLGFRLTVISASHGAARHAWRTQKKRGALGRPRSSLLKPPRLPLPPPRQILLVQQLRVLPVPFDTRPGNNSGAERAFLLDYPTPTPPPAGPHTRVKKYVRNPWFPQYLSS